MPDSDAPQLTEEIQSLLAALVEQARAMAIRIAGDPDRETQCHFCDAPLPLWENLLVLQLTGVAAHVECPACRHRFLYTPPAPDPEDRAPGPDGSMMTALATPSASPKPPSMNCKVTDVRSGLNTACAE